MEIYREEPGPVELEVPSGSMMVTSEIYRDGNVITMESHTPVDNLISVNIPFKAVRWDGDVVVLVKFAIDGEQYTRRHFFEVITPIMPLSKIAALVGTAADPKEVERFVRYAIESYTGQSFGYKIGAEKVQGAGDTRLPLPKRLLSIARFNVNGQFRQSTSFSIAGDGWYLYSSGPQWLEIKEAPPEELLDYYSPSSGPIRVPAWYRENFADNVNYFIDGEWGYYNVPADVQAAAALLVNDYACPQAAYRDRYLNIIKSSDWTLEFNEQAWVATGNARADQLLDKYKRGFIGLI